jgi:hypothetical protein
MVANALATIAVSKQETDHEIALQHPAAPLLRLRKSQIRELIAQREEVMTMVKQLT